MKKLHPLLSVLFLIYWGCEEEQDTIPPTVSIQSPITNQSINEIVTIVVETNDNEGINRVEFYIDDSLFFTDTESPYQYEWNTTQYEDNSEHIVKVISYDNSDNSTESQPIMLIVDNSESYPTPSVLYPITYNDGYRISWSQNNDDDFVSYKLYESFSQDMSNQTLVYETTERENTNYVVTGISENKYYQITNEDVSGLQSRSNIEFLLSQVELWGVSYSIEDTESLFLGSNELTGSIPPEIGNLTNLTDLNISSNELTGSIPPEIGNLTNLTDLNISSNQLTGSIPPEIGNLTNLIRLVLSNNQLTGEIPPEIGNLTSLDYLYLSTNQLTGSIPPEIGNLTNLTYLSLRSNQFTGSIPLEIGNLVNLGWLFLYQNQLTGSIPSEIGNLTNLTVLYLGSNQLTGLIPESMCDLNIDWSHDSYFQITDNQLCPPYPSCIEDYVGEQDPQPSNCDDLVELWGEVYSVEDTDTLSLYWNEVTGSIPPEIGNLTNLTYLKLSGNYLTGSIPSEIGNLTNLTYLELIFNQLTGSIPPEIGYLTNLTYLNLNENQLTGSIPSEIWNLTNLTHLYLYDNQLTGLIPESICDLNIDWSHDGYFQITDNQLCPPYPSCIEDYVGEQDPQPSNCDDLVELWGEVYSVEDTDTLSLYWNEVTGSIPPEIGNLTNLTYLSLYDNQLTGSIPPEIGNLTNLTDLNLGNNNLTGSIPPEIWNLTNLTSLELNDNQLTGEIPPEIGNLTNLEDLRLYDNQLTGSIPPEIGNLTNLGSLRLHYNQLTGSIPSEIGNMTNLTYLWLRNNQLTGIIPDEICNQGDSSPSLYNNQLCPPYPSCVEDYVGEQDTSDCD